MAKLPLHRVREHDHAIIALRGATLRGEIAAVDLDARTVTVEWSKTGGSAGTDSWQAAPRGLHKIVPYRKVRKVIRWRPEDARRSA